MDQPQSVQRCKTVNLKARPAELHGIHTDIPTVMNVKRRRSTRPLINKPAIVGERVDGEIINLSRDKCPRLAAKFPHHFK